MREGYAKSQMVSLFLYGEWTGLLTAGGKDMKEASGRKNKKAKV